MTAKAITAWREEEAAMVVEARGCAGFHKGVRLSMDGGRGWMRVGGEATRGKGRGGIATFVEDEETVRL
jgi:hypothetical protein